MLCLFGVRIYSSFTFTATIMILCRQDPIILSDFTLNNFDIQETIHFILMLGDNKQSHVSLNCSILCLQSAVSPESAICVVQVCRTKQYKQKAFQVVIDNRIKLLSGHLCPRIARAVPKRQ